MIAVAVIGYRYMFAPQAEQIQSATRPPPTVTVAKPLVQNLKEWRDFTGQFEAQESVEIRARVSGYLESVNFTDGQLVKKGDLLFVIEPRPFEIALNSAKAQLSQAQAELELAQVQLERTVKLRKRSLGKVLDPYIQMWLESRTRRYQMSKYHVLFQTTQPVHFTRQGCLRQDLGCFLKARCRYKAL